MQEETPPEREEPVSDRPSLPESYGVDPRAWTDMLMWDDAQRELEESRNYWVCSTRPDGRPHTAPVWGLWMDGAFYFSTDPASRKGRNIASRPDVVVHLESGDNVVMIEGRAERVSDSTLFERLLDLYERKYTFRFDPTNPSYGVYVVRPRMAYAWTERSFPTTATRWRFT